MSFSSAKRFEVLHEVVLRAAQPPAQLRLLLCRFGREGRRGEGIRAGQLRSPGRQWDNSDRPRYGLSVGLRHHFVSSYGLGFEARPIFGTVVPGILGQGLRTERLVGHGAQSCFGGQSVAVAPLAGHVALLRQRCFSRDALLGLHGSYGAGMEIAWLSKPRRRIRSSHRGHRPMCC